MPRLSVNQIISSRNENLLESIYFTHAQDRTAQVPTTRYTRADFKKLNNLLFLLREQNRVRETVSLSADVLIADDSVCYRCFGCSLNSLANSLSRVITLVRNHFPANSFGSTPNLVLLPETRRIRNTNGYVRNTVVSATIRFINCNELIETLDGRSLQNSQLQTYRHTSNFGRGSTRRNMPTPQITLNQAQISIDVEAIRLDEARELELNDNYQRNLSQLLRNVEREEYSQEYELSSSIVGQYITNALNTFVNNRFNSFDVVTRRNLNNAAIKLMTAAMNMIVSNGNRSTFTDNTMDIADSSLDWRHGIVQISPDRERYNVGLRLGRSKVEEWLGVGNRGPNQNRSRMNREIREKVRQLNTIFESFGSGIATTKLQSEGGDSFRIFILTNIPRYGIRFTNGVSPLAIPSAQQAERMPEFFRNPLAGIDRNISSIFNFLLGRQVEEQPQEQQLVIEQIAATQDITPVDSVQLPPISIEVNGQQILRQLDEISEALQRISTEREACYTQADATNFQFDNLLRDIEAAALNNMPVR